MKWDEWPHGLCVLPLLSEQLTWLSAGPKALIPFTASLACSAWEQKAEGGSDSGYQRQ